MNDSGQVVWVAEPVPEAGEDQDSEIFLYDGTRAIQVTDNAYPDFRTIAIYPQINRSGHIVWMGCPRGSVYEWDEDDWEIFLYDGNDVIQITDDSVYDAKPQISDDGRVGWQRCEGGSGLFCEGGDLEIFLFDGTTTTQITDNTWADGGGWLDPDLRMSGSGQMVWTGCPNGAGGVCEDEEMEIFMYDGTSVAQLTDDSLCDRAPQINNDGTVVWEKVDGDSEIFLFDGSATIQLTNDSYNDVSPDLNNQGQVVWYKIEASSGSDIFFYDGTEVVQLTHNSGSYRPKINDSGQVTWLCGSSNEAEVFLYDGSRTIQLTHNLWNDGPSEINNRGQVVWDAKWITEVEENLFIINNEIFRATPGPVPWGEASVVGTGHAPASGTLNGALLLLVPFGGVLVLRAFWRTRNSSRH
jgi:Tol biopolymer transport system component